MARGGCERGGCGKRCAVFGAAGPTGAYIMNARARCMYCANGVNGGGYK